MPGEGSDKQWGAKHALQEVKQKPQTEPKVGGMR
jgi:hypothetical protein